MNRKQRRIAQSQGGHKPTIDMQGKAYSIADAFNLALQEHGQKNLQAALDIYRLIIAKDPGCTDAYNNQGVALHEIGRYEEALANYAKAIAIQPDYAPFHYNQGNSFQALNRFADALASYDNVIRLEPKHANVYNNMGNILQRMNRYEEALASYDKAVALNPGHAQAYSNRGVTLQALNRFDEALASYAKAIALKPDYAQAYSNRGVTLQKMNRYSESLVSCDKAIALDPRCIEAYNNRSVALQELRHYEEALASCDKAIALKPDYADAYNNRGLALRELRRYEDALISYDKAIALKPDHAEAYQNRCLSLQDLKRYDEAMASSEKAIALKPDYAEAYQNRGVTLVNTGDMKEAEKTFRKVLALKPDYPKAFFSLSNIHKYKDADCDDAKAIKKLLDTSPASSRDREYLYFSLAKIYDDCGRYDEAFKCYEEANRISSKIVFYNADATTATNRSIMDVFSKDFLAQKFAFASQSRAPIFIVGMPRSGTTLMASILSNHPAIGSAGELPTITEFTLRLPELSGGGIPYPQGAKQIPPAVATRMTQDYEKRLRRDIGPDMPHIVDKNPLNFRHLGFISMLFPKACIIHCMRHPMDTGLSNYFRRFAPEYAYSFDLKNIGHFYGEYARIMEHWRNVLPTPMIEISYEDMVADTESVARRVLDNLGLEWDERCLTPHTNKYAVETASNWQVRQPIYKESLARWRLYEKHLAPLKEALQLAGEFVA